MKTKDIAALVFGIVVIFVAGYYIYTSLIAPKPEEIVSTKINTVNDNFEYVKEDFDEKTLEQIKKLSDYGNPSLENIGKKDPFAN